MERELIYLLADLCVNWGFCIPSGEHYFISKKENYLAIDFARDVVKAEEMDDHSEWIDSGTVHRTVQDRRNSYLNLRRQGKGYKRKLVIKINLKETA